MRITLLLFAFFTLLFSFMNSCGKEKAIAVRPAGPCDDSLTFVEDILPIFETKCAIGQCHIAGSLYAPFDATNYDTVTFFVNSGQLLTALKHTGVIKMPRDNPSDPTQTASTKLPDSTIQKIECWINQGYPEQ